MPAKLQNSKMLDLVKPFFQPSFFSLENEVWVNFVQRFPSQESTSSDAFLATMVEELSHLQGLRADLGPELCDLNTVVETSLLYHIALRQVVDWERAHA